jgi:hypothetical protein
MTVVCACAAWANAENPKSIRARTCLRMAGLPGRALACSYGGRMLV